MSRSGCRASARAPYTLAERAYLVSLALTAAGASRRVIRAGLLHCADRAFEACRWAPDVESIRERLIASVTEEEAAGVADALREALAAEATFVRAGLPPDSSAVAQARWLRAWAEVATDAS